MTISNRERAAEILKLAYSRMIVPEEDGSYRGEIPEFPGCISLAETPAEAFAALEDIALSWLEVAIEKNQPIPKPMGNADFSGKFALRLPRSLHKKSSECACREGVSLNQFFVGVIAEHVGAKAAQVAAPQAPQVILSVWASPTQLPAALSAGQRLYGKGERSKEYQYAGH
jgi:predicted RNase H-like HicB family nuclease